MTSLARNGATPKLIALALFVVSFVYFSAFVHYGVNLDDEGALLYKFERMADGQRAYVDYHLGYTPGVFYVHSTLQRLFAESITPGRVALALTNSASTALLGLVIAPFAGPAATFVAGLCYLALLPVNPGAFASFNVPYPTWYSILFFLAGLLVCRNYIAAPTPRRAFLAGVLAGLGFLFKPNIGAVQLACAMLLVLSALGWKRPAATLAGAAWWWAVCAAALVGVSGIFGFAPGVRELAIYVAPVLACVVLCARRAAKRDEPESASSIALDTTAVVAGFFVINVPWLAYYAARVPMDLLLREVLFVGSGYARFFYWPHPPVLTVALALTVAALVFAAVPSRLRPRTGRPALLLVAAAVAGLATAATVLARRPMVEGFAASVTTAVESFWVYPVTLAIHWLALLVCARGADDGPVERRTGAPRSARDDAFFVATVGSVFFYLQTYPRTDIMHWATAASLPVGLAFGLAGIAARLWAEPRPALRAVVRALPVVPLVLVCALRLEGSLSTVLEWNGTRLELRPTVGLRAARAPVWMNIGKAERYRDIDRIVELLGRVSKPDDEVLMFPAIDLLSFLSDRHSPLRDTYFFPGWLGHDEEARALTALEADPPPFAVVQHENRAFFDAASLTYYQLTEYLEREYEKLAQVGRFALLVRRGRAVDKSLVGETAWMSADDRLQAHIERSLAGRTGKERVRALDELSGDWIEGHYPSLVASLGDGDLEVRNAAAHALKNAENDRVGLALLAAVGDGRLSEPARTLALRRATVWTGPDSVVPLIEMAADQDPALRDAAATGLSHAAQRSVLREFWPFAPPSTTLAGLSLDPAARERVRAWLFAPESDPRLEYFAAAEVARIGAVADIARMTAARTPTTPCTQKKGGMNHCGIFLFDVLSQFVRRPAARARILYEIEAAKGGVPGAAELALDELRTDEPLAPRAVIAALEHDPAADELLAERLLAGEPEDYVQKLLYAGSVGGKCETVAAAQELNAGNPSEAVAAAAGRVLHERARLCPAPGA